MPMTCKLASQVDERLLERNQVFERFFTREAPRLAEACREMSERFLRGGRLLAFVGDVERIEPEQLTGAAHGIAHRNLIFEKDHPQPAIARQLV